MYIYIFVYVCVIIYAYTYYHYVVYFYILMCIVYVSCIPIYRMRRNLTLKGKAKLPDGWRRYFPGVSCESSSSNNINNKYFLIFKTTILSLNIYVRTYVRMRGKKLHKYLQYIMLTRFCICETRSSFLQL